MIKVRKNRMLWQVAGIYAAFIIIGSAIPRPYISSATAIFALVAGVVLLHRYYDKALDVLLREERGEYGAHNAILGAAELAAGMVYTGLWRLVWVYFDKPETWTSTVLSTLGLFMVAKGAFRLGISPESFEGGHRISENFMYMVVLAFAVVLAFVAGTHFTSF